METAWHRAYLGLGANLGDPVAQLQAAIDELEKVPGIEVLRRSSLYGSAPVDAPAQPDHVNAVVLLQTSLAPRALLAAMLQVEADFGRQRAFQNAPRTLDLDLLLYDDETLDLPDLRVPHPRMHLRRFVLEPLLEIEPRASIPGLGNAAPLLAGLGDQQVRRLAAQ